MITDASRVWTATALADLPTVIHYRTDCMVKIDRTADGLLMRKAFTIVVTQGNRFAISLFAGASEKDLDRAELIIALAKRGSFLDTGIWDETNPGKWVMTVYWEWDGEPYHDEIRECTEPACIEPHHVWVNLGRADEYQEDPCVREVVCRDVYKVLLERHHGEKWAVWAYPVRDEFAGPAGLKALRDLANDYAYLLGEADKLNAELR